MQTTNKKILTTSSLLLALLVGICGFGNIQIQAKSPPAAKSSELSAEDKLLKVLSSDASVADKCNACRALRTIGTEKSVPALATQLTDPAISHTARIALEVMPYPSVNKALRKALKQTKGLTKSGIIDSLGERRDSDAVSDLSKELTEAIKKNDSNILKSTTIALGKIGNTNAAKELSVIHVNAKGNLRTTLGHGLLRCAKQLQKSGNQDKAKSLCTTLLKSSEAPIVRKAAIVSLLQSAGPNADQTFMVMLTDKDPLVRKATTGQFKILSKESFQAVAKQLSKLQPSEQIAILATIRIHRDKSLASVVLKAAKSSDLKVKIAAINSLGTVGDVSAFAFLAETSELKRPLGDAARNSLEIIKDFGIDEQIVLRLQAERNPEKRAAWIGIIEARQMLGGVAILLRESMHDSPIVRSRAMSALSILAGPNNVASMVPAVLKAKKGAERDQAEKAIMLVCKQISDADKRADFILLAYQSLEPKDQAALLPLLGRIGGNKAKKTIEPILLDSHGDAETYESAVRALCNWPNASVSNELLELSKNAKQPRHKLWALRALIRVIALPSDMSAKNKLSILQQAIKQAERDDERILVLQRAAAVRTVESLRFLVPYLKEPTLAQTACTSVTELARHEALRNPNKAEFLPALKQVLTISKDQGTVERARRYLQVMNETK